MQKLKTKKSLRIAALWHEACGVVRVKVIFRVGGHGCEGRESAYWMTREVYGSIPLMQDATVEDYRKFGQVDEALNTDIYSNQ